MVRRAALLVAMGLGVLPVAVGTQEPPRLVSPDVHPDRTVVFRYWAPKATAVQLSSDFGPPAALTKDAQGVWTVTQGPLEPNIYTYGFIVDGARTDDPSCRCTYAFGGGGGTSNRFTIGAQPPAPWENQNRPAGTLHHERFFSKTQQRMRGAVVYTPPGFDPKAARRYPVLVLLPGTPGDETAPTSGDLVDMLFDNLIGDGKMTPAIVVMHASDVDSRTPTRRGDENLGQFEKILVEELVPLIRQRYPVRTDASAWAIAGISLGGEFSMAVGLRHPELFGSIGSISGSLVPRGDPEEKLPSMDERFGPGVARAATSKSFKVIWVGCGTADIICRGSHAFVERLDAAKLPHVWREYAGGHSTPVFRRELADLLPLLFR